MPVTASQMRFSQKEHERIEEPVSEVPDRSLFTFISLTIAVTEDQGNIFYFARRQRGASPEFARRFTEI
jgi:uncharacterized protein YtpQ (UPF0354 family)